MNTMCHEILLLDRGEVSTMWSALQVQAACANLEMNQGSSVSDKSMIGTLVARYYCQWNMLSMIPPLQSPVEQS
jgi:hypothetical protein